MPSEPNAPIRTSTAPTGPRSPPSPSNSSILYHPAHTSPQPPKQSTNSIKFYSTQQELLFQQATERISSFNPPLTLEILRMISDRDSRRAKDPADPAQPSIPALNAEIEHLIRDTARSRWISTISSPSYIRQAPANSGLVFMKENKC